MVRTFPSTVITRNGGPFQKLFWTGLFTWPFIVGLPAAGPGAPMKHDLPLQIQVPTADGTMVFESIIELKRTSETSTHWKR
jgi:hypothetical protein